MRGERCCNDKDKKNDPKKIPNSVLGTVDIYHYCYDYIPLYGSVYKNSDE